MTINQATGYAADTTKHGEVIYSEFNFASEVFNLTSEVVTEPPKREKAQSAQLELF